MSEKRPLNAINEHGETLEQFLKAYHAKPFAYSKPALTADLAIFRSVGHAMQILMVRRKNHPCIGQWALPGGFFDVETDASLEACALRELREETGMEAGEVFGLGVYSQMGRDPRDRIVSQLFTAMLPEVPAEERAEPVAGDDAADARFMTLGLVWEEAEALTEEMRLFAVRDMTGQECRTRFCHLTLGDGEKDGEEVARQTLKLSDHLVTLGHFRHPKRVMETIGSGNLAFDHAKMILEAYLWLVGA
jgi:ADP-ribose pyrophosphatase YjhB (NUDIX family)